MTITSTDLSWVTFTDDETHERCEARGGSCTAQAAYVATWQLFRLCPHRRKLYCPAHREIILRDAALADGFFHCGTCGKRSCIRLVGIDPL